MQYTSQRICKWPCKCDLKKNTEIFTKKHLLHWFFNCFFQFLIVSVIAVFMALNNSLTYESIAKNVITSEQSE